MILLVSSAIKFTKSFATFPTHITRQSRAVPSYATRMMMSSNSNNKLPISSRTLQTLDPCVILMKQIISQHADKWKDDPQGIFSLAQGVVHWKPPPTAYEALSAAIQENITPQNDDSVKFGMDGANSGGDGSIIHTYCPDEGYPPLLEALKTKLQTENGLHNPHVMVTSGANQAFVNCVLTLLDEQDEQGNISKCVVFEPYYFNHVMAVQSVRGGQGCGGTAATLDAKNVEGLLVGPTNQGIPDLHWLRTQLEQNKYNEGGNAIRMVTLVNPGNPTGLSLPYSFLKDITELTKEYGVWLVMDNTYEHFDVDRMNTLPSDNDQQKKFDYPCFDEEHVINIFSFSKGYAMAGFRVGYVALSSKNGSNGRGTQTYQEMLKVQDTIAICTSRISQMAALGALQAGREWVYDQVKSLDVGREAILDAISSLGEVIGGNGAMYVMGKLPNGIDDKEFASSLIEHYGVAVIPGSFCGLPGWIRVCYSNLPPDQCKIAAARLKKGIDELTMSPKKQSLSDDKLINLAKDFIQFKNDACMGDSSLDSVFDLCSSSVDLYGLKGEEVRPGFISFFEKHEGLYHELIDEPSVVSSNIVQYPFTKQWRVDGEDKVWKSIDTSKPRDKVERLYFDNNGKLEKVTVVEKDAPL